MAGDEGSIDAPELAAAAAEPRADDGREAPRAGELRDPEHPPREIVTLQDNIDGLLEILGGARRDLAIFSRHLDKRLYDTEGVLEAVQQLATSSPFARLRFLVVDSKPAVAAGHRLVNLGRQLSSYCEFRKVAPDFEALACEFVVVDETACLYRQDADRYEGRLHPHDGMEARLQLKTFDGIWDKSGPDPELRQLKI